MFLQHILKEIVSYVNKKHESAIVKSCEEALEMIDSTLSKNKVLRPYVDILNIDCTQDLDTRKNFSPTTSENKVSNDQVDSKGHLSVMSDEETLIIQWTFCVNKLLDPFLIACETHDVHLVELSLDAIVQLVQNDFISGTAMTKAIMNRLETCFDLPSSNIQTNIIQLYKLVFFNHRCVIHIQTLVTMITISIKIASISIDSRIKRMARDVLVEIISTMLKKLQRLNQMAKKSNHQHKAAINSNETEKSENPSLDANNYLSSHPNRQENQHPKKTVQDSGDTSNNGLEAVQVSLSNQQKSNSMVVNQHTSTLSLDPMKSAKNVPICPETSSPGPFRQANVYSLSSSGSIVPNHHNEDHNRSQPHSLVTNGLKLDSFSNSISDVMDVENFMLKDIVLVFHKICIFSFKPTRTTSNTVFNASVLQSIDLESRIFLLELLNAVFDSCLDEIIDNHFFIQYVIKKYMIDTIIFNLSSPTHMVFRLAIKLFSCLMIKFRNHLKIELETIFCKIILPILESQNSSFHHRFVVMQVIYSFIKSPQWPLDMFINYDCQISSVNILEQVTNLCVRYSQRVITDPSSTQSLEQHQHLQKLASKTCICIMTDLVEWVEMNSKKIRQDSFPKSLENNEETMSIDPGTKSTHLKNFTSLINLKQRESDSFYQEKKTKLLIEQGKALFQESEKLGMDYFYETGLCGRSPKETALFLYSTQGLDRTRLGRLLASVSSAKILEEYAKLMDFSGLELDISLRKFFSCFRLPGEGQQISRIVETFSEIYFKQNPDTTISHPDAVFFLSMAIVMLSTSLHNPAVHNDEKLTKDSWKNLTYNQNACKDFDSAMLDGIFSRICKSQFKVKDDPSVIVPNNSITPYQVSHNFSQELTQMLENARDFLRERSQQKSMLYKSNIGHIITSSQHPIIVQQDPNQFYTTIKLEYAYDIFSISALPLLASYSSLLESSTSIKMIQQALGGIQAGVRFACSFKMSERENYMTALSRFACPDHLKNVTPKTITCLKKLIAIGTEEPELGFWKFIFKATSWLEGHCSINTTSSNVVRVDETTSQVPLSSSFTTITPDDYQYQLILQLRAISTDRIFTNSASFLESDFLDFIICLCAISQDELNCSTSTFSLQKLVEVCDFNMDRSADTWVKAWRPISEHLVQAAFHIEENVTLVSIDSIRQIVSKLLEKHTSNPVQFHFQKELLSPFQLIYQNTIISISDYLIYCLAKLIAMHHAVLKNGWEVIFDIFEKTISDQVNIVELVINQLEVIQKNYFQSVIDSNLFLRYVNCVLKFAQDPDLVDKIPTKAIFLLNICALKLSSGDIIKLVQEPASLSLNQKDKTNRIQVQMEEDEEKEVQDVTFQPPLSTGHDCMWCFTDCSQHTLYWFTILKGFIVVLEKQNINIRPLMISSLFEILGSYANSFSRSLWRRIFLEVLFPVLDHVLQPTETQLILEDSEWLITTCLKFLHSVVLLFGHLIDDLAFLLPDLLDLLRRLTLQNNEKLATFGITSLESLFTLASNKFTMDMWDISISTICNILRENMPSEEKMIKIKSLFPPMEQQQMTTQDLSNKSLTSLRTIKSTTTIPIIANSNPQVSEEINTAQLQAYGSATKIVKPDQLNQPQQYRKHSFKSDLNVKIPSLSTTCEYSSQSVPSLRSKSSCPGNIMGNLSLGMAPTPEQSLYQRILHGKAWIQSLTLNIVNEQILGSPQGRKTSQSYQGILRLSPSQIANLQLVYFESFNLSFKFLINQKLNSEISPQLFELTLKQEASSMAIYIELIFLLFIKGPSSTVTTSPSLELDNSVDHVEEAGTKQNQSSLPSSSISGLNLISDITNSFEIVKQYHFLIAHLKLEQRTERVLQLYYANESLLLSFLSHFEYLQNHHLKLFSILLSSIYPILIELCLSDFFKIRQSLHALLVRIGQLNLAVTPIAFEHCKEAQEQLEKMVEDQNKVGRNVDDEEVSKEQERGMHCDQPQAEGAQNIVLKEEEDISKSDNISKIDQTSQNPDTTSHLKTDVAKLEAQFDR